MQFGQRLRSLMRARGMTGVSLAAHMERLGAPVTTSTLNYWLNAERLPRTEYLVPLATALGVTPNDLLGVSTRTSTARR